MKINGREQVNIDTEEDPFWIPEMDEKFKAWMRKNMEYKLKKYRKDE